MPSKNICSQRVPLSFFEEWWRKNYAGKLSNEIIESAFREVAQRAFKAESEADSFEKWWEEFYESKLLDQAIKEVTFRAWMTSILGALGE